MARRRERWLSSDYFLLDSVEYCAESGLLRVRFCNGNTVVIASDRLWQNRRGMPNWKHVKIDSATRGALLVPTLPDHPAIEGVVAEVPSDVVRALTDLDYAAYVASQSSQLEEVRP